MPTALGKLMASLRLKNKRLVRLVLPVILIAAFGVTATVAQSQGPAFIRWVIGSGGGPSTAQGVVLNDTLGQPIAGPSTSADGSIALMAGYWTGDPGGAGGAGTVYLPMVVR